MPAADLSTFTQERIDPWLTLTLAAMSLSAYDDYDREIIVPPPGYRMAARWTGWDEVIFGLGSEERFGVLFQATAPAELGTYIFAFRGTYTYLDLLEGPWVNTVPFVRYQGQVSPVPSVASGFYSIYNDRGGSMTQSMREQLFSLIDRFQPKKVYLTGHSLGGALAQLFALDLAVSRPQVWAANLDFATPMVGLSNWRQAYESQPAQRDPERKTVRVYNYWDEVPSLPSSWLGYVDVGRGFRTSFYVDRIDWPIYESEMHSMLNLQAVLQRAVWLNPQIWVGTFQDALDPRLEMKSDVPPSGPDVDWAAKMRELRQFQQAILESNAVPEAFARG